MASDSRAVAHTAVPIIAWTGRGLVLRLRLAWGPKACMVERERERRMQTTEIPMCEDALNMYKEEASTVEYAVSASK